MNKFFFTSKFQVKNENEEVVEATVKDILKHLTVEKNEINVSAEIIALFNQIGKIDKTFLTKDERLEIYKKKIFMDNGKVRQNLLTMMSNYDDCVFIPLVEVLNEINASSKFVEKVVMHCDQNVKEIKLQGIAEIIVNSIDDSKFCIRACQIFKYVNLFIHVPDELPFLYKITEFLYQCGDDEISYGTFVDFSINISPILLNTALNRKAKICDELVSSLSRSLIKFSYPNVVVKIIKLLKVNQLIKD